MSPLRLGAIAAGLSLAMAIGGIAREVSRFGWSDATGIEHVQRDLVRRVADRARALDRLAQRVAREGDAVAAATASREHMLELFDRVNRPLPSNDDTLSSTIWIPAGSAGGYRVLAWSGGPAEDVAEDVLARAPALTAAPGAGGLRLIAVRPVLQGDRRIAIVSTETIIAANARADLFSRAFAFQSSIGPVAVTPAAGPAVRTLPGERVEISGPAGEPLLVATVRPSQVVEGRRLFRWRVAALVLTPWVACLVAFVMTGIRRRGTARSIVEWTVWTLSAGALTLLAGRLLIFLERSAELAPAWMRLTEALMALALVSIGPGSAWWRRLPRAVPSARRVRWMLEHLFGGAVVAVGLVAMTRIWINRINPTSIENWQLPILAGDLTSLASISAVLVAQIAAAWGVASVLGVLAARWTVTGGRLRDWVAVLLWIAPAIALPFVRPALGIPFPAGLVVIMSAAAFGVVSLGLRRHYRSTSEARRLVFRFVALFAPIVAVFPLAAASADQASRSLIERDYGPKTIAAQQPEALEQLLDLVRHEIDAIPNLEALVVRNRPEVSSDAAFAAWTQTVLSRNRASSELELYDAERKLVSRFSLNVPEFGALYQGNQSVWEGSGCDWTVSGEVPRFGAGVRPMIHAGRGVCAADGTLLGAIVLHLVPDYRALPFVASANPYYEALGGPERSPAGSSIPDLQLVVYGWSLHPVFVSGRIAWPLDEEIDALVYQSREPFWRDREVDGRNFHIYFMNDRAGVYALGYPVPTALQHVTRLAEAAAVLMALFILYLALATIARPLWRGRPTALGKLFHEIRASFYRKLFLFFVLAAVGPVMLFAIAFGSYMADKLSADVESEAASIATVARRVFDELTAAQSRPGQPTPGPSDDVMVWIRQVIDQDVNLYDGPELLATSQRDLFETGLLATRTPAFVYRDVVLNRRPVSVAIDRIGSFSYSVAAAPASVPGLGREIVLTVPLASRQREIEREIDELTRGVLAGTVLLVAFAAALGAAVAARVSDPVARLTRATRLIAAGRLDERLQADSADELGRLVENFNSMTETLVAQRAELARANQLKAWAEMSRQVAHDVKNPLTPIQLAAEHLQRVHEDRGRPLGTVLDRCVTTVLKQVRLLRRIASEFSTFATQTAPRLESVRVADLVDSVLDPYRAGLPEKIVLRTDIPENLPAVRCDRTQVSRALTNLIENALQAMPNGGTLSITAESLPEFVSLAVADSGVGMDAEGARRAFEPYFSTKTGGSGLGLANAKRGVENSGGEVRLVTAPGRGTTVTVTLPIDPPALPA